MKHKRQTLSKDDPEIKDSKSKSESSLNEDKNTRCDLPPGASYPVKEEDQDSSGHVKKEDLSDQENSESVSSMPDSEENGEREGGGEVGGGEAGGRRIGGGSLHSPLASPTGPPRVRGEPGGPGLPVTATMAKNKLTSLVNLSPTTKSMLPGTLALSAPHLFYFLPWTRTCFFPLISFLILGRVLVPPPPASV